MTGETDLKLLISSMEPSLDTTRYVFCTSKTMTWQEIISLEPKATFVEEEGITLVLKEQHAIERELAFNGIYHCFTLNVHSSLEAVGLTAAFANALTEVKISANVIAGFYHDHIFIKSTDALLAQEVLIELAKSKQ